MDATDSGVCGGLSRRTELIRARDKITRHCGGGVGHVVYGLRVASSSAGLPGGPRATTNT